MRTVHFPVAVVLGVAALTFISGCGKPQDGGGTAAPAAPPAGAVATAQESNTTLEAIGRSTTAATDAIVTASTVTNVNTGDSEAASSTKSAANQIIPAPTTTTGKVASSGFSFATTGTLTIDLDAPDGLGGDRYPNASGTLTVAYDSSGHGGPVISQPGGTAGVVAYTVTVICATPCTFTDPRCNASATLALGSTYSYDVEIVWNRTDANHWTVHTDVSTGNVAISGTGSRPGVSWTASLTGTRHAVTDIGYNTGMWTITRTVIANWTVNTVRNGVAHTVIWNRPALDSMYVSVDGTTYGPYTVGEVWWWFSLSCR